MRGSCAASAPAQHGMSLSVGIRRPWTSFPGTFPQSRMGKHFPNTAKQGCDIRTQGTHRIKTDTPFVRPGSSAWAMPGSGKPSIFHFLTSRACRAYTLCMKELAWKFGLPAAPGRTLYAVLVLTIHMPNSAMQKLDATLPWPLYSQSHRTMDTQHSLAGVKGMKPPRIPKKVYSTGVPSLGSVTIAPPGNLMGRDNF